MRVVTTPPRWRNFVPWRNRAMPAQFTLGLMFEKGQGVAKDEAEAAKWYRKARFCPRTNEPWAM